MDMAIRDTLYMGHNNKLPNRLVNIEWINPPPDNPSISIVLGRAYSVLTCVHLDAVDSDNNDFNESEYTSLLISPYMLLLLL